MRRIYIDTCVWIDWIDNRKGKRFMCHQGDEARDMLYLVEEGDYCLITSDLLENQLKIHLLGPIGQYVEYARKLKSLDREINIITTKEDREKADQEIEKFAQTQFEDALHITLALRGGAEIFVTQNEPDFSCFRDRIGVTQPRFLGMNLI